MYTSLKKLAIVAPLLLQSAPVAAVEITSLANEIDLLNSSENGSVIEVAASGRRSHSPSQHPTNQVILQQNGQLNRAFIQQQGQGNQALHLQNGTANFLQVEQNGMGNVALGIQHGTDNHLIIQQHGHNGQLQVVQNGNGLSTVVQSR